MLPALALLVAPAPVQAPLPPVSSEERARLAQAVREEARHAWKGYRAHAWGHDELRPLSGTAKDWYGESLLMTPVDALDTLILLDLKEEAAEAQALILKELRFDRDLSVKGFEINIRLLGGLLSAHQLTGEKRFLALAQDLGDRLLPAFDSPTGMPYMFVNLRTGAVKGAVSNPAEIGTYLLEFGTLSKLTGRPVYFDKAKRALRELFKRRSPLGLVGSEIDVETGKWTNPDSHVSGGIDSYYEYLLKAARLFDDAECAAMWKESLAALNKYVAHEAPSGLWYGPVDMNSGARKATVFGSLDAFFPAVLALSGDLDRAKRLEESCFRMWTLHGVEPEELDYTAMKATDKHYVLRPEIIESAYYLRFFTGDARYFAMGRTFLADLRAKCRTPEAFAALEDVSTGKQMDQMESFFFAETLKYLYLLFAPDAALDLRKVVFNTEAHPLRRTW